MFFILENLAQGLWNVITRLLERHLRAAQKIGVKKFNFLMARDFHCKTIMYLLNKTSVKVTSFGGNMSRVLSMFALFLTTVILSAQVWAQNFNQGLNQFYYEENNAIMWQQRFAAAPSGSWEEAQARQSRDIAIQRAVQAASPYAFQGMDWTQIENFADQMNGKFNAAPSGGAIEGMYRQVRDVAYQAFNQALQYYVQYYSADWRQLLNLAAQLDAKFNAAPSGSQKERAYDQARRLAYQRVPQSIEDELNRTWDYRSIETQAEYFTSQFNAAPSGSLKENIFNQARRSAYTHAFQKFSQQAYSMPAYQLWQIQEEYNSRFNAAPSGSLQEGYFRQVRDLARSLYRP